MACLLVDTQTPDILSLTPTTKANVTQPSRPWGRLYSTYIHLEPVDLEHATFKLGRSEDCDVIITDEKVPVHRVTNISKSHFLITKEENLIYIQDLSKNGTFINGALIGKGKKNILQDDDEIAIGFKALKVYVFKSLNTDDNKYLPPELRKRYQVSRTLGVGACGEVRLVIKKVTCKPYAIKKIMRGRESKSDLHHPDKIKEEIQILKTLNHPCVIRMEEIVETNDAVFIVLDYMEGGELSDLILSCNRLTEDEVKFLFYQIILAVQYLHNSGVVHRDLKPENILLKKCHASTIIKLSDFGLSKIVDDNVMLQTVCGTPNYVAPEVIDRSVTQYTKQADIWSLGVILYYMLSQQLPFKSNERVVLNRNILNGRYDFHSDGWLGVSDLSKDLVRKMLTVNPAKRIKLDQMLAHPWIKGDIVTKEAVEDTLYGDLSTTLLVGEADDDDDTSCPSAKRLRTESC